MDIIHTYMCITYKKCLSNKNTIFVFNKYISIIFYYINCFPIRKMKTSLVTSVVCCALCEHIPTFIYLKRITTNEKD